MSRVVVQAFISLDGVIQAPGGVDEDPSGDFDNGGWSSRFEDRQAGEIIQEWESRTEALLLGRKTYDIFSGSWGVWDENAPGMDGEFTHRYNRVPKYVASRTLSELAWKNSHLLEPDVVTAVSKLREEPGGEIRVWGSTELIQTLAANHLVDEYRLMVYPLVLGGGKRLFKDGLPLTEFRLDSSTALPSGILINIYQTSR